MEVGYPGVQKCGLSACGLCGQALKPVVGLLQLRAQGLQSHRAEVASSWLWVKNWCPRWHPGKWNQGRFNLRSNSLWINFDPYPVGHRWASYHAGGGVPEFPFDILATQWWAFQQMCNFRRSATRNSGNSNWRHRRRRLSQFPSFNICNI